MPFGTVTDADGAAIDFDAIYDGFLKPAVSALGLDVVRCDAIEHAGTIHHDMFRHIAADDVALVDISALNPNVFYELGVRHALRANVTILIKRRGTRIPFNIQSERIIEYPPEGESYDDAMEKIRAFVQAGRSSTRPDSPIFNVLQEARKDWRAERITRLEETRYAVAERPEKAISIITGDVRERNGIDVWVNSENTNMQMSRFYDRSLSAIIRFEGARKDDDGNIVEDTIADELQALMRKTQTTAVAPGTILVTNAGSLAESHGVKKIFHAATVIGTPGKGYQTMNEVENCVTNVLRRMDDKRFAADPLRSVVFPMLGTGAGGAPVEEVAPRLIEAAVSYLCPARESRIETVYFSAWNYRDLEACE